LNDYTDSAVERSFPRRMDGWLTVVDTPNAQFEVAIRERERERERESMAVAAALLTVEVLSRLVSFLPNCGLFGVMQLCKCNGGIYLIGSYNTSTYAVSAPNAQYRWIHIHSTPPFFLFSFGEMEN
jgi:hypothetical protein